TLLRQGSRGVHRWRGAFGFVGRDCPGVDETSEHQHHSRQHHQRGDESEQGAPVVLGYLYRIVLGHGKASSKRGATAGDMLRRLRDRERTDGFAWGRSACQRASEARIAASHFLSEVIL